MTAAADPNASNCLQFDGWFLSIVLHVIADLVDRRCATNLKVVSLVSWPCPLDLSAHAERVACLANAAVDSESTQGLFA